MVQRLRRLRLSNMVAGIHQGILVLYVRLLTSFAINYVNEHIRAEDIREGEPVQDGLDTNEEHPMTQERVKKRPDGLPASPEEAVLEQYRVVTGEDTVTNIEDTTEAGVRATFDAWSHHFETLFVGSIQQTEEKMKKYEEAGLEAIPAHVRLQFIIGNRHRDFRTDAAHSESLQ